MSAAILPADLNPQPVLASGMFQLTKNFTGTALTLYRPPDVPTDVGTFASFSFGPDGKLPLAAIDAFRAGKVCRVATRAEQMNGLDFGAESVDIAPMFGALTLGGHRCMWMEGDAQIPILPPPPVGPPNGISGQVYGLVSLGLTALNIIGGDFTVMQVLQVHNSMPNNQASGICRYCSFSMSGGPPEGGHTRIFAEANQLGNPTATTGGGFTLEDTNGFRVAPVGAWLETSPVVMTARVGGDSIARLGQNEDFRSLSFGYNTSLPALRARIGYHEASLPPTPIGANEAFGGAETATLLWRPALSVQQMAAVRASLYEAAEVDHLHSHSNVPLVMVETDSIWAGFRCDDLRGFDKWAMLQLPTAVRFSNFAVPGSFIIPPPSPLPLNHNLGYLPGWIAQAIRQHRGRVHCVWGAPLNDLTGPRTPEDAYNNGTLALLAAMRAIDPTITFTICTGFRFQGAGNPVDVKVTAVSQLIRDGAAANGYGVVDIRADPKFSIAQNPEVYKDTVHLTNFGAQYLETLIQPRLTNWLQSLGPYP